MHERAFRQSRLPQRQRSNEGPDETESRLQRATGGKSFVDGWAAAGTAKVVVTLTDGTEIEVTELVAVEGFDVRFCLVLLPPITNGEPELPITATAFDQTGAITADFTWPGTDS